MKLNRLAMKFHMELFSFKKLKYILHCVYNIELDVYFLFQTGDVIPMAVPSSFNDITQNKTIRDYLGWSWYEKNFFVQNTWNNSRIVLRFGSAHYFTIVVRSMSYFHILLY